MFEILVIKKGKENEKAKDSKYLPNRVFSWLERVSTKEHPQFFPIRSGNWIMARSATVRERDSKDVTKMARFPSKPIAYNSNKKINFISLTF